MENNEKDQPVSNTVRGQTLSTRKHALAKQMRHEMTPAEARLWACLRTNRLNGIHFRRQQVIEPYIVDFYCHQVALIIEIDGDIHQYQQKSDLHREEFLKSRGYRVIRFTNQQVMHNIEHVLEEILLACEE